ncbi:MAG: CvpA family protein [Prevotellaceae bacterium]|jgi:membrane protein required for colicin V production|nr:CvpA family protein [Prevotellaceae bacterium]
MKLYIFLIDLESFSVFDLIFLIAIAISVISGFVKGFARQLLGLAGILIGTYCSYKLSLGLTEWWRGHFNIDADVMKIVVFIILSSIIYALVLWLAMLLGKMLKMAMLNWINRLFGMLFGAIKVIIIFSALAYAIHFLKQTGVEIKDIDKSIAYGYLIQIANSVFFFFESSTERALQIALSVT